MQFILSGPDLGISSQNSPDLRSRSENRGLDLTFGPPVWKVENTNLWIPPLIDLIQSNQGAESLSYAELHRSRTLSPPIEGEIPNFVFEGPVQTSDPVRKSQIQKSDLRSQISDLRSRSQIWATKSQISDLRSRSQRWGPDLRSEIWDLRSRSQIWKARSRSGPLS